MRSGLERDLATYETAVVTWIDTAGYPFSARCRTEPDRAAGAIVLDLPAAVPVRPSAAGLLCHSHDEKLWHLRSFILKGTLDDRDGTWLFVPHRRTDGAGYGGLRGYVRFVRRGRRTAAAYLRARGLPPPRIDWTRMRALKRRAFQDGSA
jgi:hypothetical protein